MSKVNALLNERTKKQKGGQKTAILAQLSAEGSRTGIAGIFGKAVLSEHEKQLIEDILISYGGNKRSLDRDLTQLLHISAEVKAINNQAALLHGERISKARELLKSYEEGAFTAWILAAYGNRQTPYNFMQYYEFYQAISQNLHPRVEQMPRQAVYTLASREGDIRQKEKIIENYEGQSKEQLLEIIRETFPLDEDDKRKQSPGAKIKKQFLYLLTRIRKNAPTLTTRQRKNLLNILEEMRSFLT